ncbi:FRG domain-containing protein [Vibrio lentus]|uniref:FRG domain-containing protein n=1 Tax=Vibrio lentus TaxID=136468 RepID=A0AB36XP57_9VIBR|nr:FRG domain-containing protein [Vibrio lentus]MCC4835016.1 FRG domain-containing protein [Vibrio lentus]PMI17414.1 hypothetical protein BCU51_01410 [Vibrio lentus]PMK48109.1 hypothetical protein BCT99_14655 [Vibrio lentus]PML30959.1 hypothetical protein BCT79_20130 [Vibrio lentus]PMM34058.1 hypothetical protein BCT56_10795 [Vibrio lentus]
MSSISQSEEHYEVQEKKYFLNLPVWPQFAIHNKTIDGLIPSCRVESWEEFDQVVKHYCDNDMEGNFVFRGQKHYKWQLEPTLDRLVNGTVTKKIAEQQLDNFRLSTRGRINDKSILNSDSELWALGQHHGLATPLLDWSRSPYVALFFAFEGADDPTWVEESTNYSRTIFILNKSFIQDLNDTDNSKDGERLKIVEPSIDDHGRLVNQAGLFTFAPYGEILESALYRHLVDSDVNTNEVHDLSEYICRIHIPNEPDTRNNCLKRLHKMNIHHASLFPDLIGASGYCNDLIREALLARQPNHKVTEGEVSANKVSTPSWDKHRLEPKATKSLLLESLIINESIRSNVSPNDLSKVVDDLLLFINEKAGVDWYKKDPILARLRNIVRRDLRKKNFPDDFISPSTNALISRAADMSKAVESRSSD